MPLAGSPVSAKGSRGIPMPREPRACLWGSLPVFCAAMNVHAPIVLGDRQEQFCQQILLGKSHTEAYAIAYGASAKAASANGSRLIGNDRVKARIAQLRAQESAARRVSLQSLTVDLRRAGLAAEGSGQHGAAVAAWMGLAKLHGFLIDKQQVDLLVRKPSAEPSSPDEMTEEAWLAAHSIAQVTHSIDLEPEPQSKGEDER